MKHEKRAIMEKNIKTIITTFFGSIVVNRMVYVLLWQAKDGVELNDSGYKWWQPNNVGI